MKGVLLSVLGVLVAATLALPLLRRLGWGADLSGFAARLKAWWVMAVLFVVVNRVNGSLSLVGFAFLSWLALREYLNRIDALPRSVRLWCYLGVPLQYYWVYLRWYGMFIVFIPVYMFLYLPTRLTSAAESIRQAAAIHWGLMATVFCVSHAAFLLVLSEGGPGLLLFVMLLTELGEAARLLFPATNWRLLLVLALSAGAAALLAPVLTPLSRPHALLAGFVLGLGGDLGGRRLHELKLALGLGEGPLKPGQGGALVRVIALTYTAPLFLHGFRYFYTR